VETTDCVRFALFHYLKYLTAEMPHNWPAAFRSSVARLGLGNIFSLVPPKEFEEADSSVDEFSDSRVKYLQDEERRREEGIDASLCVRTLRRYQEDLVATAIERNSVITLPTGTGPDDSRGSAQRRLMRSAACALPTGKTLIAFKVMEYFRHRKSTKPVCFVTQGVALMFQQAESCERDTKMKVGRYLADKSPRRRTSSSRRL
jgi:hypothetical protein